MYVIYTHGTNIYQRDTSKIHERYIEDTYLTIYLSDDIHFLCVWRYIYGQICISNVSSDVDVCDIMNRCKTWCHRWRAMFCICSWYHKYLSEDTSNIHWEIHWRYISDHIYIVRHTKIQKYMVRYVSLMYFLMYLLINICPMSVYYIDPIHII